MRKFTILLAFFTFTLAVNSGYCQTVAGSGQLSDIDEVTLSDLRPGDTLPDLKSKLQNNFDTIFYGGSKGASMFQINGLFFSRKGEYRVATQGRVVSQITFIFAVKDTNEAARLFKTMDAEFESRYGDPSDTYSNQFRLIRWTGEKQVLSLQAKDGTPLVSVLLTKHSTELKR